MQAQHGVQRGAEHGQIARRAAHIEEGAAEIGPPELHDPRGAQGHHLRLDGGIELEFVVHKVLGNARTEQGKTPGGLIFYSAFHGQVAAAVQPPTGVGHDQQAGGQHQT